MAIGEIIGLINSNPQETLDQLIKRMFTETPMGGGLSVEVIPFTTADTFPYTAHIGTDCIAFVQELKLNEVQHDYVFINRDEDIITDTDGNITVNVVRPFNGRIVLVRNGGDSS